MSPVDKDKPMHRIDAYRIFLLARPISAREERSAAIRSAPQASRLILKPAASRSKTRK